MGTSTWLMLLATAVASGPQAEVPGHRLYGRVVTAGGQVYEGYLRWDRNEGSWADVLNGSKELPFENLRDAERYDRDRERPRRRSLNILGLRISWQDGGEDFPTTASSGIRFGHVRSLRVTGNQRARLVLKSGDEIELEGGSTDLGDDLRELLVEDPERGEVVLRWRDLDRVEFMPAPAGAAPPAASRLYGTLRTARGDEFTGFLAWDVDEILTSDVLDGREGGRERKIPFHRIAAIERAGASAARVVLQNGEEITLRGSNDVNDANRGISISDPGLGQVTLRWNDFESVSLFEAPADVGAYDDFTGGYPLLGEVETIDGQRYAGTLRWDNDEAYSWEILDGRLGDVDLDVEFGRIERVVRLGSWGSEVRLRDGRTFELEGSNDVDRGNKGIYLTFDDGERTMIRWRDVRAVTFVHP